jgi:ABC transport system ATP-binding/permease protein
MARSYLSKTKSTLLMVTHDRYFLDRVCNEIIEMEDNRIYRYQGNYSYFLQKRAERIEMQQASIDKAKNLLRKELDWMRRMPKARSHKAKYRVDSFYETEEKARQKTGEESIGLNIKSARLGNKIVEMENVSKAFPGVNLIDNFTYKFQRFEKAGIIGKNGSGKTTFLKLLTGSMQPDKGNIEIGQTIKFGFYRQEGIDFDPQERVIDAVSKIAEFIIFEDGTRMTCTQLLSRFLFPPETQYNFVNKLSGGEKRRLYLCTVLMQNPNFLILDEPTNDLDILTLNVLEDYLKAFEGCVLVVSHDRFFMDKIVDHLFVFDGNGSVTDFPGNYSVYRQQIEKQAEIVQKSQVVRGKEPRQNKPLAEAKKKLSFKDKKELELLEEELEAIGQKKEQLEVELSSGELEHEQLHQKSEELEQLRKLIDLKEMRWLELSEMN